MIELEVGSFDTHEYLGKVREKRSSDFQKYYQSYSEQFTLE